MPYWGMLHFAMGLAVVGSCIALIICRLHMIEKAELEEWKRNLKSQIQLKR